VGPRGAESHHGEAVSSHWIDRGSRFIHMSSWFSRGGLKRPAFRDGGSIVSKNFFYCMWILWFPLVIKKVNLSRFIFLSLWLENYSTLCFGPCGTTAIAYIRVKFDLGLLSCGASSPCLLDQCLGQSTCCAFLGAIYEEQSLSMWSILPILLLVVVVVVYVCLSEHWITSTARSLLQFLPNPLPLKAYL
jgi:hypothetical protein